MPLDFQPISIPVRSISAKVAAMMVTRALDDGDEAKAKRIARLYCTEAGSGSETKENSNAV